MSEIAAICRRARVAARVLGPKRRPEKDAALRAMADGLRASSDAIVAANQRDVEDARARGTSDALLDRLALDARRVAQMADAVGRVADLPDPGRRGALRGDAARRSPRPARERADRRHRDVYEARPNVTVDASALCLKAGNAVVLRGGSEAARSNAAIARRPCGDALETPVSRATRCRCSRRAIATACASFCSRPRRSISPSRAAARRSSASCSENARVPGHRARQRGLPPLRRRRRRRRDGDASRGQRQAAAPGHVQRDRVPARRRGRRRALASADRAGAPRRWVRAPRRRADARARARGEGRRPTTTGVTSTSTASWRCGSSTASTALSTTSRATARGTPRPSAPRDAAHAERWRREVDAACVVVNASTRFHDGGELGLGAEIGTATSKLHWRGTMGLAGPDDVPVGPRRGRPDPN